MLSIQRFSILAFLFFLVSCGGSEETISEDEQYIPDEEVIEEEAAEQEESFIHVIVFRTPDYETWRQDYAQRTMDEDLLGVFENLNEEGSYLLAEVNRGNQAAMDRHQSEQFQDQLSKFNCEIDRIEYMNLKYSGESEGIPFRLLLSHELEDFGTWQDEYWKLQETRNMAGITTIALAQDHQNQSRAHIWLGVKNVEVAKEIINTEKMKTAMEKAGVIGNPSFSWWKPLE